MLTEILMPFVILAISKKSNQATRSGGRGIRPLPVAPAKAEGPSGRWRVLGGMVSGLRRNDDWRFPPHAAPRSPSARGRSRVSSNRGVAVVALPPSACIFPVIYRQTHRHTDGRRPGESRGPSGRQRALGGMDSGFRRNDNLRLPRHAAPRAPSARNCIASTASVGRSDKSCFRMA